jgi:protein involved in polysaccharide export with SLBB domain
MTSGRRQLVRLPRWAALVAILMLSGCLSAPKQSDSFSVFASAPLNPAEVYTLACPDVVEVVFNGRSDNGETVRIDPDGRVRLRNLSPVHVEGDTPADAAADIAEAAHLRPEAVHVEVAEFNSRQLCLFGQVNGGPRVVEYHGPEKVVDVLSRTGGLAPSAASNEIYIVRAQMTEGMPAEVLTVDLQAIYRGDSRTNFCVQPLDEIYVGEMPRARIGKAIPTLLKPLYDSFLQMLPYYNSRPTPNEADSAK